jgi:uncharacterized protein (TIGR02996 family)
VEDFIALLRAIRAHPEEDTPRLVVADWLDKDGDHEWAEFIRVQIRLAQMLVSDEEKTDEYDAELDRLFTRERELLAERMAATFEMHFSGSYGADVGPDVRTVMRGFPDTIDCVTSWWVRHADDLLTWFPIHAVDLWTVPLCEQSAAGFVIVGDHRRIPIVPIGRSPDERVEIAVFRTRWPEVRFNVLSDEVPPEAAEPLAPFLQPHTDDANMVAIQEANRRRQYVAGFASNPPSALT